MPDEEIGIVTHYFGHIGVAAIEVTKGELNVGDKVHIKGHTSDFDQMIDSMEVEHNKVEKAKRGQTIGIKVKEKVREHDKVYKVTE